MRTFKIKKVKTVNPKTKAIGFSARVQTHARITFEQIAEEMCENTTLNPAEALMSARLLVKKIAARVQEGYIVEIGELGSLQQAAGSQPKTNSPRTWSSHRSSTVRVMR